MISDLKKFPKKQMPDKKDKIECFRAICPRYNVILRIKSLPLKEEAVVFQNLAGSIDVRNGAINISSLKERIVELFLLDYKKLIGKYEPSEEELSQLTEEDLGILKASKGEAISTFYKAIVNLFPGFSIENICTSVNQHVLAKKIQREHKKSGTTKKVETNTPSDPDIIDLSDKPGFDKLVRFLNKRIIGQNQPIKSTVNQLKLKETGFADHLSILLLGPTGVGKTELVKILGASTGSGLFKRINCGGKGERHEKASFIGSPPGYAGSDEPSMVETLASQSDEWTLLFDEIEKADETFFNTLLSLVDEGIIEDNSGETFDLSKSNFFFTSNEGTDILGQNGLGFNNDKTSKETKQQLLDNLKDKFSPEFLNRIDEIIVFNELTEGDVRKICKLYLKEIPVKITPQLVDFVTKGGYSKEYGARYIRRFIKQNVSLPIAEAMLDGVYPSGKLYEPAIRRNKIKLINTEKLEEKING